VTADARYLCDTELLVLLQNAQHTATLTLGAVDCAGIERDVQQYGGRVT